MKSKIIFISLSIATLVTTALLFNSHSENPDEKKIKTDPNTIVENIHITASLSFLSKKEKELSQNSDVFTNLELHNSNDNSTLPIIEGNELKSLYNFQGSPIASITKGDTYYFVIYGTSTQKTSKNDWIQRKEQGSVYSLTDDGTFKAIYTTKYPFISAEIENGSLVLYEKKVLDESTIYPSYLKEYEKLKMVFNGENFVQTGKSLIKPAEKIQNEKA